jgi:hypothetical protein
MGEPRTGRSPGDDQIARNAELLATAGADHWRGKVESRIEGAEELLARAAGPRSSDVAAAAKALSDRVTWVRAITDFQERGDVVWKDYPQLVKDLEEDTLSLGQALARARGDAS